jgi:hypothetical protein
MNEKVSYITLSNYPFVVCFSHTKVRKVKAVFHRDISLETIFLVNIAFERSNSEKYHCC